MPVTLIIRYTLTGRIDEFGVVGYSTAERVDILKIISIHETERLSITQSHSLLHAQNWLLDLSIDILSI